jgi:hypothetical protein
MKKHGDTGKKDEGGRMMDEKEKTSITVSSLIPHPSSLILHEFSPCLSVSVFNFFLFLCDLRVLSVFVVRNLATPIYMLEVFIMKTVVIIGSMDTKGEEFAYLKRMIEKHGLNTLVVDTSTLNEPRLKPDICNSEVVKAIGVNIEELVKMGRGEAMEIMSKGAEIIVRRLYEEGKLDGIIGMGGSGGTAIATAGMRSLPVGVPKVMVSTVAASNVTPYIGTRDIAMIPSVVDVAGLNRISRQVYANAAGAIVVCSRPNQKKYLTKNH